MKWTVMAIGLLACGCGLPEVEQHVPVPASSELDKKLAELNSRLEGEDAAIKALTQAVEALKDRAGSTGTAPALPDAMPVVQLYTIPNCGPCVQEEQRLIDAKIPYVKAVPPQWAHENGKGFPQSAWRIGNEWHYAASGEAVWKYRDTVGKMRGYSKAPQATPAPRASVPLQKRAGPRVAAGKDHWSVEGDYSPSKRETIRHLIEVHGYDKKQLAGLSLEELLSIHDQAHGA